MTAAAVIMSTSSTPVTRKRHGFSIESLIGSTESPSPALALPPRPLPIRPLAHREHKEDRHREREAQKQREICEQRERQCRGMEREADLRRERELVVESMRDREREFREMRDRELTREREMRDGKDNRDGRCSKPHFQRLSSRSNSPPSPHTDTPLTPQSENRLGAWPGDETFDLKHFLGNLHPGHLDSSGIYQPLRVCNRALASIGGMPGAGTPPITLGLPAHFSPLHMNPLLYNLPRELSQQTHPLLTARYPGFMHARYQIGPPPGLLFHPYRKPKRNRTAFSPSQLLQLEQAFEKNHYVVGQERKALAAQLQLTETQVKVWFQNRRTKHKRMKAEEDGGSSGSQVEVQEGDDGKSKIGNDFSRYVDDVEDDDEEEEVCSEGEEEEELSVTEDC